MPRFTIEKTALLVVDMQQRLLPHIHRGDEVVAQTVRMIRGATVLGLPIIVTEQNPAGLGETVEPVRAALGDKPAVEHKMKFSACIDAVCRRLGQMGRSTVVVCGIEAHVCVMQTALDLIDSGHLAAVALDAIGSRWPRDYDAAVQRMTAVGVVPVSVEMALLELVHEAGTARFKSILPIIK